MAIKVPQGQRTVQESGLPGVRVNTRAPQGAFGGGQGVQNVVNQAQGLLSDIDRVQREEKKKADIAAYRNISTKFLGDINKLWNDPEEGFAAIKGKTAAEKQKAYEGRIDHLMYEYENSLANDRQKELFREDAERVKLNFKKQMQGHVFREIQQYDQQETEANLKIAQEYALQNYKMPGKVGESLTRQEAIIREHGERTGLPPEAIEQRLLESRSATHFNVIQLMLSKDEDSMANTYFQEVEEKVDSDTSIKIRSLLERKEREKKQKNRLERDLIMEKMGGMQTVAEEHGDTTALKESASKLMDLGFDKEARRLMKMAKLYDKSYPTLEKVKTVPIKEAITMVQEMAVGKDPETAEQESAVRKVATQALQKKINQYRKDPVEVIRTQAIGATPEERVSSRLKLQEEQGITLENGYRALSNAEALELKGRFEQGSTEDKVQLVQEIEQSYGKHKGMVLKEMGVPQGALLAQYFPEGKSQELVLSAATSSDPEILNNDKRSDYSSQALNSDFVTLLNDVQEMMPQDANFNRAAESIKNTMVNAAIMTGDPSKARTLFDENFSVVNDSNIKAFIPKDFDEDDVENHLEKKRNQLVQEMTKGQDPFKQREISQLIKQAVWVNSGDGFVLLDTISGKAFDSYTGLSEVEELTATKFNDIDSVSMSKY